MLMVSIQDASLFRCIENVFLFFICQKREICSCYCYCLLPARILRFLHESSSVEACCKKKLVAGTKFFLCVAISPSPAYNENAWNWKVMALIQIIPIYGHFRKIKLVSKVNWPLTSCNRRESMQFRNYRKNTQPLGAAMAFLKLQVCLYAFHEYQMPLPKNGILLEKKDEIINQSCFIDYRILESREEKEKFNRKRVQFVSKVSNLLFYCTIIKIRVFYLII